jgi:hypothetical protein
MICFHRNQLRSNHDHFLFQLVVSSSYERLRAIQARTQDNVLSACTVYSLEMNFVSLLHSHPTPHSRDMTLSVHVTNLFVHVTNLFVHVTNLSVHVINSFVHVTNLSVHVINSFVHMTLFFLSLRCVTNTCLDSLTFWNVMWRHTWSNVERTINIKINK